MFRKKYTAVPVACRSIPYPVVQEVQEVRWYILHTCMCTQIPCVPVVDTPVTKKFPRSIKLLPLYNIKKFTLFIFILFSHKCLWCTCVWYIHRLLYLLHTCVLHIHIYRGIHIMYILCIMYIIYL